MSYEVYRVTTAAFDPNICTLITPFLIKTTFEDDRLSAATTYVYRVYCRKVNSTGPATHIGDISATTPAQDAPLK